MADASNPQLQRYELWSNGVALEHAERGGWVKYEDALAAIERLMRKCEMLTGMAQAMGDDRERLRAALEQYGRHENGCPSVDSHDPCTCGFAQFCVVCRHRAGVETTQERHPLVPL